MRIVTETNSIVIESELAIKAIPTECTQLVSSSRDRWRRNPWRWRILVIIMNMKC